MDELVLTDYFENLCIQNKAINHTVDGRESFFYIENGFDLEEFDEALRSSVQSPVMLLVADSGELNDNDSENHTDEIEGEFYLLGLRTDEKSIKEIRSECKITLQKFLARMKRDSRKFSIVPGKGVHFRINKIPYEKVGPMFIHWYGYKVSFAFVCPFGYTVDSGSWRDIT